VVARDSEAWPGPSSSHDLRHSVEKLRRQLAELRGKLHGDDDEGCDPLVAELRYLRHWLDKRRHVEHAAARALCDLAKAVEQLRHRLRHCGAGQCCGGLWHAPAPPFPPYPPYPPFPPYPPYPPFPGCAPLPCPPPCPPAAAPCPPTAIPLSPVPVSSSSSSSSLQGSSSSSSSPSFPPPR